MMRQIALASLLGLSCAAWTGCGEDGGATDLDQASTVWPDQRSPDEAAAEPDVMAPEDLPPPCISQCGLVGKAQCASQTAFQECMPEGGCLAWTSEIPCEEGQVCEEGQCVQAFGDLDCIGVSKCVAGCQEEEQCQEDCYYEGTEQGQTDFDAFLVCTDTFCGQFFAQEKPAAGSSCTLENCKNEYVSCVEVGSADCGETLQCMEGCNEDNACLGSCVTEADFDALIELTDILVCFEENCPDPATWQQCATSQCLMQSMACL
jgi:hypothetical protein